MSRSFAWLRRALAVALVAVAPLAQSAEPRFPQRNVRLIAAQEPGSATDKVARIVADALEQYWGTSVIVDNRPGVGGTIGAEAAARAQPDGYTLLLGGYSNLVVSSAMRDDLRYDASRDFLPLGRIAVVPFVFAVHPSVPAHTLREFVAYARTRPGALNVGSLGTGVTAMGTGLFVAATGVEMTPIEYRGATSAITDLVAGRIDFLFNEIAALGAQARGNRVRLLAVAMPSRIAAAPDVPTTAEQGLPSVVVAPWYGVLAPAGIPPDVAARLREAVAAVQRSPVVRDRIAALGYEPIEDDPGAFARQFAADLHAARQVVASMPTRP